MKGALGLQACSVCNTRIVGDEHKHRVLETSVCYYRVLAKSWGWQPPAHLGQLTVPCTLRTKNAGALPILLLT